MNPLLKKIIWVTAWVTLFFYTFWLNIPPDWAAGQLEIQATRWVSPWRLEVSGFDTDLTGVSFSELTLSQPNVEARLQIKNLQLSFAPWNLLLGRVGFAMELYQGHLEGTLSVFGQLKFQLIGLEPNRNLWLRQTQLIRSNPTLEMHGTLNLLGLQGELEVELLRLSISGKQKNTGLMMNLPDTEFKKVMVNAQITGNQLSLQTQLEGDLAVSIDGTVGLNLNQLDQSQVDLKITGRVQENYKKKLGFLASFLQPYTTPSGRLSVSISGTLPAPQIKRL